MKRVAIVGKGRVGSALALALRKHFSVSVHGRGSKIPPSDFVFVCVPEPAWRDLHLPKKNLVSVSGSMTRQDFADLGYADVETFHPLMTFVSGEKTPLAGVPLGVSSRKLARVAKLCGAVPFTLPENRTLYHAGAVAGAAGIVSTFLLAAELLVLSGLDEKTARRVLLPMATKAVQLAAARGADALTGPVARGDEATLARHRQALSLAARDDSFFYEALVSAMRRLRKRQSAKPAVK